MLSGKPPALGWRYSAYAVESSPGHIHMLLRSTRGAIFRSDSIDYGATWSVARATSLPNNNSGINLVSMQDGTLILALNPVNGNWGKRYPLSLIASRIMANHGYRYWTWKVTTVSILIPLLLARAASYISPTRGTGKISYIVDYKRYKALSVETDSAGIIMPCRRALSRLDGRNSHDLPGNILENVSSFCM